jgi:hypothetical protein
VSELADDSDPDRRWLRLTLILCALAVVAGVGAYLVFGGRALPGTSGLRHELRDRGRIAVIGDHDLMRLEAEGSRLLPADEIAGLPEALAGTDEAALAGVLQREGIGGALVDGRRGGRLEEGASLEERLRAYSNFEPLRGVVLTPTAALYERRRGLTLEPPLGEVLARAARQIVGGSALPRIRSFPEPLRRTRNVEVMVMLMSGSEPRLWRSARGGSIARALVTAASVARQRWSEREQAMGGPIDQRLPRMTVKVFLLEEDGTLTDRSPSFIERVFTPAHGVAFEHRGSWHYLLPEATRERGEGSAVRAYEALFDDAGLAPDSLQREDLRLYRLVAREVGTSPPAVSSGAPPSPAPLPGLDGELLGPGTLDEL